MEQQAVILKNVVKNYGAGVRVLKGLSMNISKGAIYGLLGASGCGKTTLLSCIVGTQRIDGGEIWVLGGSPGSAKCGIPGPRVGYMPQEISLIREFTTSDALYYFGSISGLESQEIESRQKFLSKLLDLPSKDQFVRNMSGCQQRRISFAAALIHKPELLILDEPTVGLDPVLRENIWAYLVKITQEEGITVVITTHYIEEAKDANKIGLMRDGILLAESSPSRLLQRFQCTYLEEAFINLSQMQENDNMAITSMSTIHGNTEENTEEVLCQDRCNQIPITELQTAITSNYKVSHLTKFKALMKKNSIQFLRYREGMIFAILYPILQVSAIFIGLGLEPQGLTIGVVNYEAGNCNYGNSTGNIIYDETESICHFDNLSCRFLHDLGESIVKKIYYDDVDEAVEAVRNGKLIGVMHFGSNFSEALHNRIEEYIYAEDVDLVASEVQVFLDMADIQVGFHIRKKLFDRFIEIFKNVLKECNIPSKLADLPIHFEHPIHGTEYLNYAVFTAPCTILMLVFYLATIVSMPIILIDREAGIWKRSLVQGVTTTEIIFSHMLIQTIIVVIHTILALCLFFFIWGMKYQGPIFALITMIFFSGFSGLMYGFVISIVCTNHNMANYMTVGSLLPMIICSGTLWPLEAMQKVFRSICYILPLTMPSISMRAIIEKGYSIEEPEVFLGFLIIIIWSLIFITVGVVYLKIKSI